MAPDLLGSPAYCHDECENIQKTKRQIDGMTIIEISNYLINEFKVTLLPKVATHFTR